MAKTQLTKNTTTGNWELTETNQGQHYTNTLETAGKAVDGDIKIDITAKSGSASVNNSTITPTFSREGNVITVTGSTTTTGTATAGWVSSVTSGTSSISSTNNVNKYTIPSASSFTLSITDKASTNLTVGTLSSGYYPFTTSLTGTLSASTGGYFTSGSATDSSVTVGRLPAAAYGSETTTQPSTTTYPLAKTVTPHPTSAKYFTIGAGYNPNQQVKINPMSSGTAAVPSASVSSYTAPSVAVSGTATGFTPSSSATSYYVTVNGSGTNGSVKAKYTNSTAGYAPQNTTGTESSATTITPTITGGGTKIYISTESPTVTPSMEEQTINHSDGKLIDSVTVKSTLSSSFTPTASSSTIYLIMGTCKIVHTCGSSVKTQTLINTYFKISSISLSGFTFMIPKNINRSSSGVSFGTGNSYWNSITISNSGGSTYSCNIIFSPGTLCKCVASTKSCTFSQTQIESGANPLYFYSPWAVFRTYCQSKTSLNTVTAYSLFTAFYYNSNTGEVQGGYGRFNKFYPYSYSSQYAHSNAFYIQVARSSDRVTWDSGVDYGSSEGGSGSGSGTNTCTVTLYWFDVDTVYE